jgi:uncharacterized protein
MLREDQLHRALEHRARRTGARLEPVLQLGAPNTEKGSELLAPPLQLLALLKYARTHLGPAWLVDHGRVREQSSYLHGPTPDNSGPGPQLTSARFRFADELARFLSPVHRGARFEYSCARAANLKNAIEALGVPHTEVGRVLVNGAPATLQRTIREGDEIEVLAPAQDEGGAAIFLADAHLGGLARFLRMMGFDTVHDQALADAEIRRIAHEQGRVVLTRDRELLKCREIERGCYVRALKPESQLREVATRYRLAERARPFTLCLHCNRRLAPISKDAVAARVPAGVLALHTSFTHCAGCDRVYWPGTHYERMRAALAAVVSK